MNSSVRILLASSLLVAAGCSGSDDASAPTPVTGPEVVEPTPTGTSAPGSVDPEVGSEEAVGEVSTTVASADLDVVDSTAVPGGAPPSTGGGGESLGPLGDTDLDVETDAGRVQIGEAEVPSGLDAAFPLPDDLGVQLASETATDIGFSGTTERSIDELTQFYATGLPQSGYTITTTQIVEGVLAVFTFEGGDRFGQVAISETPGAASSTLLVTIGDGVGQEDTVSG